MGGADPASQGRACELVGFRAGSPCRLAHRSWDGAARTLWSLQRTGAGETRGQGFVHSMGQSLQIHRRSTRNAPTCRTTDRLGVPMASVASDA